MLALTHLHTQIGLSQPSQRRYCRSVSTGRLSRQRYAGMRGNSASIEAFRACDERSQIIFEDTVKALSRIKDEVQYSPHKLELAEERLSAIASNSQVREEEFSEEARSFPASIEDEMEDDQRETQWYEEKMKALLHDLQQCELAMASQAGDPHSQGATTGPRIAVFAREEGRLPSLVTAPSSSVAAGLDDSERNEKEDK